MVFHKYVSFIASLLCLEKSVFNARLIGPCAGIKKLKLKQTLNIITAYNNIPCWQRSTLFCDHIVGRKWKKCYLSDLMAMNHLTCRSRGSSPRPNCQKARTLTTKPAGQLKMYVVVSDVLPGQPGDRFSLLGHGLFVWCENQHWHYRCRRQCPVR